MKNKWVALGALLCFSSIFFFFSFSSKREASCPFCEPKILNANVFFEGERVFGLVTHKPALEGHVMVIPKRHVERFELLSKEEILEIQGAIQKIHIQLTKKLGHKDYALVQKNGSLAGQSVPHVHFHYLPGNQFLALKFCLSGFFKPLNEKNLNAYKERMKSALEEPLFNHY